MFQYSYEANYRISNNIKINQNNSSDKKLSRLLYEKIYKDFEHSDLNLNDKFQKNHKNLLDSLNPSSNFDSSNDSLNSSHIFDGSNYSLNSDDYIETVNGQFKGKPFPMKKYKPERKDDSHGILSCLKKLDSQYEREVRKLLGVEGTKINEFTGKPLESVKKVAFKVFAPIVLSIFIAFSIMFKSLSNSTGLLISLALLILSSIYFIIKLDKNK
ncbi:Plasmodium exported protein, unknown function [Plasmodium malariae]|nr:Plasmodium exported protein, unknown function [Plasmodium malariae]